MIVRTHKGESMTKDRCACECSCCGSTRSIAPTEVPIGAIIIQMGDADIPDGYEATDIPSPRFVRRMS